MAENRADDVAFEAMLKEAVAANFRAKMNAMPPKDETLREHPFSDGHNRRMEKLFAVERRKPMIKKVRAFAKAAVLVLCVAAVLFGAVLAVNPQVRAAVWEAIVRFFEGHTEIEYREPEAPPAKEARDFFPQYIPEGYTLTQEEADEFSYFAVYENADGDMFLFSVDPPGVISVDNDNFHYYTEEHDGITYHINQLHDGEKDAAIIWLQDDFMFNLAGAAPVDELMKMARSMK